MTTEETAGAPRFAQEAHENVERAPEAAPQRKRMVFKKRDPEAAAKLEAERVASMKKNPFGDAKPREAVLAERTGKDEATVVKEDASTYDIHLKLNSSQFAEKKARQHEIDDLKADLSSSDNPEQLQEDITKKEAELAELIKGFEEVLIEEAKSGMGARVDRTKPFDSDNAERDDNYAMFSRGAREGGQNMRGDRDDNYSSFSRGQKEGGQPMRGNRGSFQPGAYEDTGERESRRDGGAASSGGGREGGGKGRRGGGPGGRRDDGGWGVRDGGGLSDGFNAHAFHGKGHSTHSAVAAAEGPIKSTHEQRAHVHGGNHTAPAAMAYPMHGMGFSYAAPPMFVGYTMPASKADYQPVHGR